MLIDSQSADTQLQSLGQILQFHGKNTIQYLGMHMCRKMPVAFASQATFMGLSLSCRVEKETGMLFRFVIGHTESKAEESAINQEIEENGAFLRLPIQVYSIGTREDYLPASC